MLPLIALMMEAVSISETSVNFYETTWRNIAEGYHHQSTYIVHIFKEKEETASSHFSPP
jgi:hypothetical protein